MTHLIVASLGTDHHPFNRLVSWLDAVAAQHDGCHVVVQHGHSAPPRTAEGRDFYVHGELIDLFRRARVVVCHGGPGTLMDARNTGHVPVLVPRDPRLGEHVDGHQLRFASAIEDSGMVEVARKQDHFDRVIAERLAARPRPMAEVSAPRDPGGLAAFVAELDGVSPRPRRITPVLRSVRRVVHR